MATISVTIPDDRINDVRDAFAVLYGWNASMGTKTQFAKAKLAEHVKNVLKEYKAQEASNAARLANEIDIT